MRRRRDDAHGVESEVQHFDDIGGTLGNPVVSGEAQIVRTQSDERSDVLGLEQLPDEPGVAARRAIPSFGDPQAVPAVIQQRLDPRLDAAFGQGYAQGGSGHGGGSDTSVSARSAECSGEGTDRNHPAADEPSRAALPAVPCATLRTRLAAGYAGVGLLMIAVSNGNARFRVMTAALAAAVALAFVLSGCSSPHVVGAAEPGSDDTDIDVAIQATESALKGARRADDRVRLERRLRELRDRGASQHVAHGDAAFAERDLLRADAAYRRAATYAPDDHRVQQGFAKVAQIRTRAIKAVADAREALQRWTGTPYRDDNRAAWNNLAVNLDWLGQWERDVPEAAALRSDGIPHVASFFVWDAQVQAAAGAMDGAIVTLHKALKWAPQHAEAVRLLTDWQSTADAGSVLRQSQQLAAERRFDDALALLRRALERSPGTEAIRQAERELRKLLVTDRIEAAEQADRAGQLGAAVAALAQARAVGTDDTALAATLQKRSLDIDLRAVKRIHPLFQTAVAKRLDGAALVFGRAILALLTDYKDVGKRMQAIEANLPQRLVYKVEVVVGTTPRQGPAGVGAAASVGLQRALGTAGVAQRHVSIVARGGKPDSTLRIDVPSFSLLRRSEPEERSKPYLDRVDVVDNPDWPQAQGRQTTALAELNGALDKLRPVLDDVNKAEANLHLMQEQLLQIRRRIADEDAAWYKTRPSPCKDGTLTCRETRAHQRWLANLDYYVGGIEKENSKLLRIGPQLRQLQQAVDELQKAFDAAQKVASDTPRRQPHEVWKTHGYQVMRHTLAIEARVDLILGVGATQRIGRADRTETRADFSTETVMVNGQVLEPQKANELPDDASVTAELLGALAAQALPAIVDGLLHHAQRHVAAAQAARSDVERVHHLVMAALSPAALTVAAHAEALQRLADLTGWRADSGVFEFERAIPAR